MAYPLKYFFFYCEEHAMMSIIDEKETLQKYLSELRKNVRYIEETDWMFDNEQQVPYENVAEL